jgi:hypothetical protein
VIANGRVHGDIPGKYTCFHGRPKGGQQATSATGHSCVDYVLLQPEICMQDDTFMSVLSRPLLSDKSGNERYISDHCPIYLKISCPNPVPPHVPIFTPGNAVRWKPHLLDQYVSQFQSAETQSMIDTLHNNILTLDDDVDAAANLLIDHVQLHVRNAMPQCRANVRLATPMCTRSHKPWFDGECRAAHKAYRLALKYESYDKVCVTKATYHTLIQNKKRKHENQVVQNAMSSDSKSFWSLFRSRNINQLPFSLTEAHDYFKCLLNPVSDSDLGMSEGLVTD